MKKVLINYAHRHFLQAQQLNTKSAIEVARFDEAISYGSHDIDQEFIQENQHILHQPKGAGYWLWKPYFIDKTLKQMNEGDLLFYSDSGAQFIHNIKPLIEPVHNECGLLLFSLEDFHQNKKWTKRDCFVLMGLDNEPYLSAPQISASFIVCLNTSTSRDFVAQWLEHAKDPRIITDEPNTCGLPNYGEFVDHRHDQSILSLLGYKHNISTIPDISQHGNARRSSAIPQIMQHTRNKN